MIPLTFSESCPHCHQEVSGNCEAFLIDTNFYEREMGPEVEYTIDCDSMECPHCGREFALSGSIWEYPEGVENLNDLEATADIDDEEDNTDEE